MKINLDPHEWAAITICALIGLAVAYWLQNTGLSGWLVGIGFGAYMVGLIRAAELAHDEKSTPHDDEDPQ